MIAIDFRKRLDGILWADHGTVVPRRKALALRVMRTLAVLCRDATRGELTLRAMSLVYTTLLSLVPLLALSFSVLKAFGVHNLIRPFLEGALAPLGPGGDEVAERMVGFIDNMNVGILGSMGLALLMFTAVSVIQKIEEAFNFIWHIAQPRGFGERFSRYLTLLLVGPILVFSALGITGTVANAEVVRRILAVEPVGHLFIGMGRLMPYLLVIAAFSFAYYFIPNTRVQPSAALLGGLVAGVAWQTAGWAFAEFAASSGQYRAIYSGFAILILFMIWLYLSWLILLFGASVAFYCQRPEYLVARGGEPRLSNRMRERLALGLMSQVVGHFLAGRPPLSTAGLARRLGVPDHAIQAILDVLEEHRLLARAGGTPATYLPSRDPAGVSLLQVLEIVRSVGEARYLAPDDLPRDPRVDEVFQGLDTALRTALADLNLVDIAATVPASHALSPPAGDPARSQRSGRMEGRQS